MAARRRALAAAPGAVERWTSRSGEASELAQDALGEGFEAIVAVGGDGTFSEVLNGFLSAAPAQRASAALAAWPAGSGCDLARHFCLAGVERLESLLKRPVLRRLDAGLVEFEGEGGRQRRYFANVVTVGLGGDVARLVEAEGKRWGGTLSYLLAAARAIAVAAPRRLSLSVDGAPKAEGLYHLLAVANTRTTGGGMLIAPQADPFDGLLDLVAVEGLSRARLLARLPLVYWGKHLGAGGVSARTLTRLSIGGPEGVWLNIDGEAAGRLPAHFTALPAALPFLLPG